MSGSGGAGRPPWWRRPRALAAAAVLVALAVALTVVLVERQPKANRTTAAAAPQVALQPVAATGPDPFTGSVVATASGASASATRSVSSAATPSGSVDGGSVGLYGGTKRATSCDVAQLVAFLTTHADKGAAWAQVEGIQQSALASYLQSLTPAVLRVDTRVTNHGFANGTATSFQSVLQAGSAVLVDSRGVPRARCACGNPLLPPVDTATPTFTGTAWPSFRAESVVTVKPAAAPVKSLVMVDQDSGTWFARPVGSTGESDATVTPPSSGSPSGSGSGPASTAASASRSSHSASASASTQSTQSASASGSSAAGAASSYASP